MTHTSTEQPEALRLADDLQNAVQCYPQLSDDDAGGYFSEIDCTMDFAAAELRRLYARVQELEASQAQRAPLSGDDLADVLMSFHGYISGDVADFVAHVEAAQGITQEKQG